MKPACLSCGGNIGNRSGSQAKRCLPCAQGRQKRIASPQRQRHGVYKPLRLNGGFACVDCFAPVFPAYPGARGRLRCDPCSQTRYVAMSSLRSLAASAVARAVRIGELPAAKTCTCVDCGRPAEGYDHRDYTQPLKVDPVCRSCNVMRGPADVWPDGFDPTPKAYRAHTTPQSAAEVQP